MEQGDATRTPQSDGISEKIWHRESLSKTFVTPALAGKISLSHLLPFQFGNLSRAELEEFVEEKEVDVLGKGPGGVLGVETL